MVRSFLSSKSSSSTKTPASLAFLAQTEKNLLKYCKNNAKCKPETAKWNKKAVQCLLKTLKDNKPAIEELERAVAHQNSATKCIRMPKTYENRLLVSHRRGVPHVIFSRIWRWPDLQSHHQLNAISNCECNKASKEKGENDPQIVCVNPYHYERRKPDPVPPVLVPTRRIPPDLSTSFEDSNSTGQRTISDKSQLPPPLSGNQVRRILEEHDHVVAGLPLPAAPIQDAASSRTSSIAAPSSASSSGIASGSMHTTSVNTHQAASMGKGSAPTSSSEMGQRHRKHKLRTDRHAERRHPSRVLSQQNPAQTSQQQPSLPRSRLDNYNSSSPLTQEDLIMWTPRREISSLTHPAADDDEYDVIFNRIDSSSINLEEVFPPPVVAPPREAGDTSRVAQPSVEQPLPAGGHLQASHLSEDQHKSSTAKQQAAYKERESTMGSDADNEHSGEADVNGALRAEQKQQSYSTQETVCERRRRHRPKGHQSSPRTREGEMSQTMSPSSIMGSNGQVEPQDDSLVAQMLTDMSIEGDREVVKEEGELEFVKFGDTYQAINYKYEKAMPFRFDRDSVQAENRQSRSKERYRHEGMSSQLSMGTSSYQASMSHDMDEIQAAKRVAVEKVPNGAIASKGQATTSQEVVRSTSSQQMARPASTRVSIAAQTQRPSEHLTERSITKITKDSTSSARASGSSSKQSSRPSHPQWSSVGLKLKGKFKLGEIQPAPSPRPVFFRPKPGQDLSAYRKSLFVGAQEVPYVQVLKWCTINYLEHGTKFPEEFTPKSFVVTVDTSSSKLLSSHWSLGSIEGFDDNHICAFIRRRIGRGIKLTYVDGDVYVENLNDSEALFVSSPVMSYVPGEHLVKEKVIRVPTESSIKVFSTALFASILNEGLPRGYEYMRYLQSFCTFRVSFVKGWGIGYKRFEFSDTPCALLVELNGHLEWAEKLTELIKDPRYFR